MDEKTGKIPGGLRIKITDEVLKGVYANNAVIAHTREEFIIDFINVVPPEGIVTARIILSPGHMKRIVRAMQENLRKYEEKFGEIKEASLPEGRIQ